MHDICFVTTFDSFISAIMLKTLKFKPSDLFGTHTLSDKSLRALQLPTHLIEQQIDSCEVLDCIHLDVINKSGLNHTYLIAQRNALCMTRSINWTS